MNGFITFMQNPIVSLSGWGFGLIGCIIGAISAIAQFRSMSSQKKLETAYKAILDQASLDWKGKFTEDQINELTTRFQLMKTQIQIDIPKFARKVVLENQIEELNKSIQSQYEQLNVIKRKIDSDTSVDQLDPNIKRAIESEISPKHSPGLKSTRILTLVVIILLMFTLFPYLKNFIVDSVSRMFSVTLGVYPEYISYYLAGSIIALCVLFMFTPIKIRNNVKEHKLKYFLAGLSLIFFWYLLLVEVIYEFIDLSETVDNIASIISILPLTIGIWLIYNSFRSRWLQNRVERRNK